MSAEQFNEQINPEVLFADTVIIAKTTKVTGEDHHYFINKFLGGKNVG